MSLLATEWRPPRRQLRQFGWLLALILALAALYVGPSPEALALQLLAALLFAVASLWPAALRVVYVPLVALTAPVGWAVGHALLALVYYAILTPVGLALRLWRRDPLRLRCDPAATSYWESRSAATDRSRYYRQY